MHELLVHLFMHHFATYQINQTDAMEVDSGDADEPLLSERLKLFDKFCVELHRLNVVSMTEEIFTEILFNEIEKKISSSYKEPFSKSSCLWLKERKRVILCVLAF
jgi:hypothetical protein